jgi:2-methylisocitrate lyase-like PEP mutase family enzyme
MTGAGARFRALLEARDLLVIPGGYSPLMARMAEAVGYESFFMAGSQTAAYLLGSPNVGLITMREMVDAARRIVTACTIPIIADGDEGYGNALNTYRAALEFASAGTAAITIEDRRNATDLKSHAGPRIALDEALGKLQAAVAARDTVGSDMLVIARSDVMDDTRAGFDDAFARCMVYKEEGGADAIFINAVPTRAMIEESCRSIPGPVIHNYLGSPPPPSLGEWRDLGASAVIFPLLTTSAGLQAIWDILHEFRERGVEAQTDASRRAQESPWGAANLGDLLRLEGGEYLADQPGDELPQ